MELVMKRIIWISIAILAVIFILFGGSAIRLYTDWLWFSDLGFSTLFSKVLWSKLGIGIVFGTLFFAIAFSNLLIAKHLAPRPTSRYRDEDDLRIRFSAYAKQGLGILLFLGTLIVSIFVGLQAATHWQDWLLYSNASSFGVTDPVFSKDIGFYVFKLPFLNFVYSWLFFTLFATAVAAGVLHYANEGIDYFANTPRFSPGVKAHLAVLIAGLFFLRAFGYWLQRFDLLTASNQTFMGAGYTDIHVRIPALWVLGAASVICGVLVLLNINRRGIQLAVGALAGLVVLSIIAGGAIPAIVEPLIVRPNQLAKQSPYIVNAIKSTRQAFQVDQIQSKPVEHEDKLSPEQIARNQASIDNLRLWDYGPLQSVYNQLQVFQTYYQFFDVDIDRYMVDGKYRQVLLSARELTGPPENAQSWINQFLRYTHGYAYAMSPVNEVTPIEGLPNYFTQGIPPATKPDLKIDVPQIYFGEGTNNYVLVNTRQKEFDYLKENSDNETQFSAESGPAIGSFFRKLAFAIRFADSNILLSNDLAPTSRILFHRNIADRAQMLFPFLSFDNDPYLVTVNGRMYWFHDAYTTTNRYPYSESQSYAFKNGVTNFNYIRNSVKLVTDAYTGKVQAFVMDSNEPIIKTYSRIFPGVFRSFKDMPKEFQSHIRYPEDQFNIQAHVYAKYHMTNPSTFYGQTDLWQVPVLNNADTGQSLSIEPYYIITRLPNSKTDEFILIVPFVRSKKENMVAWMAAKCDVPNYGQLIVYQFPSGERVFGPSQINARANQNTEISQKLTLWGSHGSDVIRGNLLAIPIENSILYVQPLYLQSTTTQIPEFKEVIVALGDSITMEPTLAEALAKVVGVDKLPTVSTTPTEAQPVKTDQPSKPTKPQPVLPSTPASPELRSLAKQAAEQLKRAEDAQKRGDWATYGKELDGLKKTVSELQKRADN